MDVLEVDVNNLAESVSNTFQRWDSQRAEKKKDWEELRNFLYATDTTKTSNSKLPWSNKTTLPKLTQVMENLVANYEATLFPNEDWLKWEAADKKSALADKAKLITEYTKAKLRAGNFRATIRELLYDWVIYGNVFATIEYVKDATVDEETGEETVHFVGGKVRRISPYDIVFNPTATSFDSTPKITRYIKTIGDLALDAETKPELLYSKEAVKELQERRNSFSGLSTRKANEIRKAFSIDGFGSIDEYYGSGVVELLEFVGDIYDTSTGTLYRNYYVTVADRKTLLRFEPVGSWNNKSYIKSVGWRPRQDNLWAMSPLENLVGIQYRIDHLENLKADVMDMIAYPIIVQKGDVEFDGWVPGAEVYLGEDGAIDVLRVDSVALQFDSQISMLEAKMEEYAGAPREAMGIRSPGEKTAFEVQQLQNAASRLFQAKVTYFEEMFLEPLVNQIFEVSRRNLDGSDLISVINEEFGIKEFLSVTKQDLQATGTLYPRGARHFAERARFVQEATQVMTTMPPSITAHLSGKAIAKAVAESLNLDKIGAYKPNVAVMEQVETQQLVNAGEQQLGEEAATPTEGLPDAPGELKL